MACAAGLILALASALIQDPAGAADFQCVLPEGYAAFQRVPGAGATWDAAARDAKSRFQVQYFELEVPGARAELVARDLRQRVWDASFGRQTGYGAFAWQGVWGGLPDSAGHTVRYTRDAVKMAALERIGIVHDRLVHFSWEGPEGGLQAALTCAESFRVPDAWIPAPPPAVDLHRGLAPGSEARPFPWSLAVKVDLAAWQERGVIEVSVRAASVEPGGALPAAGAWRLPDAASALPGAEGEARYRLDPQGGEAGLARWGIARSPQDDLAACDAAWVAAPDPGPGRFLPPAWTLEVEHAGHVFVAGPDPARPVFDEAAQRARTRFAAVPAGRSWPFFLAGRFDERLHAGTVWKLRKDAKALTPDLPVAALARLQGQLSTWMPGFQRRASLVSFPGIGDRVLPGLIVLDESREWFAQPMDSPLGGLTRRIWLARMVAASCFGVELRGSGNGAPVLENALAEYAAARLLEGAGWKQDAESLRAWWSQAEAQAGPLPLPLSLLPPEDVLGSQRILTAGARFWMQLETAWATRAKLDAVLQQAVRSGRPWSTQDLVASLAASGGDAADIARIQAGIEGILYAIPQP